jgi:N-acetyl-anhydromuramyl-L-alanine amidase AmpD
MRRPLTFLLLAAAIAAPAAAGAVRDPIPFVAASPSNYEHAHRSASAIKLVVVHDIEGTYSGAISWFRNPAARSSAHFVVSRDGRVTQMVPTWDVAWHAGNGWVNRHSVGIEHEGYTNVVGMYTDAEYRASARVSAALLRRSHLSADRRHMIGHSEVPDPNHAGLFGGFAHHTDPGRFWDWTRYVSYVRSYLKGAEPPPLAFDVTIPTLSLVQSVTDVLPWQAAPVGVPADHLDFLVDGIRIGTVRAEPWQWSWDSTAVPNGKHLLTVHAVSTDGRTADASVFALVSNVPISIPASSLGGGEIVSGVVSWSASVRGKPNRVEFLVDGVVRHTESFAPFVFPDWDTTQETEGPHQLSVRAVRRERVVASKTFTVVVTH